MLSSRIRTQTSFLTTFVDEAYDKYILINGKSFDLILNDEYLYSNFLFTCSIIKTIIGYNFSAFNKKIFVDLIKHKIQKNATVLAIGDGFNDILMLNSADVGIEMINKRKNNKRIESNMMIGDLVLNNFQQIQKIMINYSGAYFDSYQKFTQISYYKSFIYGFCLFVFAFFDDFYSNCLYDPLLTFFYFGYFNIFSQVLCLIYYKKIPNKIREDFFDIYNESKYQKKIRTIIKALILMIFEGVLISFIITIITLMSIMETINDDGFTSNYNDLGFIFAFSFVIFIHLKVNKNLLSYYENYFRLL